MPQTNFALLEFNPELNQMNDNKKLCEGLSAVVVMIGMNFGSPTMKPLAWNAFSVQKTIRVRIKPIVNIN